MAKSKKRHSHSGAQKKGIKEGHGLAWWRRLLKALPGVLITLLLIFLFSRLGALHKLETRASDTMMRLAGPRALSNVVIVEITEEDYQTIFGGQSPLCPAKLQLLIGAIASGNPKGIGVDIDTSSPQFKDLIIDSKWPPIIWEQDYLKIPENENEQPEPVDVLGGKKLRPNDGRGMPLLLDDAEDGVTRRYRRMIDTTEGRVPSFPWAVVEKFPTGKTTSLKPTPDRLFINYAPLGEASYLSASMLLQFTQRAGSPPIPADCPPPNSLMPLLQEASLPENNPLRDKIVLLGGTYGDDDLHHTPLGPKPMYGVQILAQVIETEYEGGGDKAPGPTTIVLLELFEGVLVIILFHSFHSLGFPRALMLSLLSVLVVSVVCSYLSFGSALRATVFIPVLICVLIYEFSLEYRIEAVKKLSALFGGESHHAS